MEDSIQQILRKVKSEMKCFILFPFSSKINPRVAMERHRSWRADGSAPECSEFTWFSLTLINTARFLFGGQRWQIETLRKAIFSIMFDERKKIDAAGSLIFFCVCVCIFCHELHIFSYSVWENIKACL